MTRKTHIEKVTLDLICVTAMWSGRVKLKHLFSNDNNLKTHKSTSRLIIRNNLPISALSICVKIIESRKTLHAFKNWISVSPFQNSEYVDLLINQSLPLHLPSSMFRPDDLTVFATAHSVRMAVIKKNKNNKFWQGCGEKGTLLHCWWECKLVQSLWKTGWRFLKKLKIELPYDPAIPLLGIYPKRPPKNTNTKRYMHPNVHSSTIYNC